MTEENSYEQLAEVFLSLKNEHTEEDIYCLCSRVVIKGNYPGEFENSKESSTGPESTNHYFSSSTESPPLQKVIQKKESHEEAASCYCSASHCSTDEHDSIREPLSDSGADVSESSRDLDWERYWAANGERIVWDAWLAQYSDYIDPAYNKDLEGEETLFAVETTTPGNHKTTFSGCLDSIKETNESSSAESAEAIVNYDIGDSIDEAPLRLSFSSESSKLSISVATTTDSLTNVTRITVSSSDFSLDESSRSGLSSDSSSCDHQWQHLWAEHVDRQYRLSYHNFITRQYFCHQSNTKEEASEPVEDHINLLNIVDALSSQNTNNPYVQLDDKTTSTLLNDKTEKASHKTHKKPKISHRKNTIPQKSSLRQQSVGYLLQSLRSISLEEGDNLIMSSSDDDPPTEQDARRPPPPLSTNRQQSPVKQPLTNSIDRAKGAFTLMGLTFAPGNDAGIKTAQVVYKKRNIRSHNRALRFYPPRDHSSARQTLVDKVRKFLDESEVGCFSAEEDNLPPLMDHDLFSEKDDSESDKYYSAEESTPSREKQQKRKRLRRRKTTTSNLPKEIADDAGLVKYWCQRYRLFSRFDEGIRLDSESWYSVTPEKVAAHIAERCRCDTIIDAFCGAGGNAIQFAFTCERVIAIDIDPSKVDLAIHNAKIYGVEDRIEFIVGDFFALAPHLKADVIFLSPPWGGPDYASHHMYSIDRLQPSGGANLYNVAKQVSPHLSIYLPKNVNTSELIELAGAGGFVEVEQNFLEKKLVAVSAYYGELVGSASEPSF